MAEKSFIKRLGPGVVFAAMAIGVSHLVQSTRAGGEYGLSLVGFVLLAIAIKYPLFRFASLYSASTGKTLLEAYREDGRPALGLLIVSVLIDMFIATAAVSVVTAGITQSVLGLQLPNLAVVGALCATIFVILVTGKYHAFERFVIWMVLLFTGLTIVATLITVPEGISVAPRLFPAIEFTPAMLLFLVAMAGWMPNPPSASFFLSAWSAKRREEVGESYDAGKARFDFDLGYAVTIIVALAFVLLGAILLFARGVPLETGSAVEFADTLMSIYTSSFGPWALAIVGAAALMVMFSTMITLFDGAPRVMCKVIGLDAKSQPVFISLFLAQMIGVLLIVHFFTASFAAFINFATSVSFATAPFIALLNHRAIMREDVPADAKPGAAMRFWSIGSIIALAAITIYFFTAQLSD